MVFKMYSMYDRISQVYSVPVFFETDEEAVSWFKTSSSINSYRRPSDVDLVDVGSFDVKSGQLSLTFPKNVVITGNDIWLEESISQAIAKLNEATERYNQACNDYMKMIKGGDDHE